MSVSPPASLSQLLDCGSDTSSNSSATLSSTIEAGETVPSLSHGFSLVFEGPDALPYARKTEPVMVCRNRLMIHMSYGMPVTVVREEDLGCSSLPSGHTRWLELSDDVLPDGRRGLQTTIALYEKSNVVAFKRVPLGPMQSSCSSAPRWRCTTEDGDVYDDVEMRRDPGTYDVLERDGQWYLRISLVDDGDEVDGAILSHFSDIADKRDDYLEQRARDGRLYRRRKGIP